MKVKIFVLRFAVCSLVTSNRMRCSRLEMELYIHHVKENPSTKTMPRSYSITWILQNRLFMHNPVISKWGHKDSLNFILNAFPNYVFGRVYINFSTDVN